MNDVYVEAFNNQTFNKDGNESAVLKNKNHNPCDLMFQYLPKKEKVKNIELNRMRKAFTRDTLTSVDDLELVKNRGEAIEIYEGVLYRENFKKSPLRKVTENFLALTQKYKDEQKDLLQFSVQLKFKSLYGV